MTTDSESTGLYPYAPPSRAPAASRSKRSTLTRTAVALAVVLGTGAGSVAVAQAAATGSNNSSNARAPRTVRTPPAAAGKVATVSTTPSDSFTLTEHNGTVATVDVGSTTTYRDGKVTAPTFANVKVGEMVSVQGTTASGTVTATSVWVGFGGGMGRNDGWGGPPPPASTS
jgi:hypothetical protein